MIEKPKKPIYLYSRRPTSTVVGMLLCLLLLFPFISLGAPGINKQIPYQGVLKTSVGVKVTDGDYDIVFKIYDASSGGNILWTGAHTVGNGNAVTITDGVFSVLLGSGSGNTITLDFNDDTYYLGVKIGSDSEMTPRKRIGASGYAFNADLLDGIDSISFFQVGVAVATSTTSTVLSITQNSTGDILNLFDGATEVFTVLDGGNVGIGSTSPSQKLSVEGNTFINGALTVSSCVGCGGSGFWSRSGTNTFLANSGDNIGIGTTTPFTKISIAGDGYFDGDITVSDIIATGTISVSGTATSTFAGDIAFNTNTLYVDSINSRVGIGTSIPDEVLHLTKAVDGASVGLLVENSQANTGGSVNETAEIRFGFGGNNDVARIVARKASDYTNTNAEDSQLVFYVDENGTDGEIAFFKRDGLHFESSNYAAKISFNNTPGGMNGMGIFYLDSGSILRSGLTFPGSDVVRLSNRASNGIVEIRANTATGGSSGEVLVAQFEDDKVHFFGSSAGNVGIGTTNPSAELDVVGVLEVSDEIQIVDNGSATDPGITWENDGNTGIFTAGADILGFTTGGLERVRIDASGNVGIGTTDPKRQFDFDGGNVRTQRYIDNDSNTNLGYGTFGAGNLTNAGGGDNGLRNVAIGWQSMYKTTTGYRNTTVGWQTLYDNTTGYENTAIGRAALNNNVSGNQNTAIGKSSLFYNTTGNNNTAFGYNSGISIITGSNNIVIGYLADVPADGDNQLSIGNTIYGDLSTGNIGIGTTSPLATFSASSTNAVTAIFDQRGTSDIFQLQDSGSTVFVVQDGGNVGIGEVDPKSLLEITSAISPLDDLAVEENYSLKLHNSSNTNGKGVGISFSISSTDSQQTGAIVAERTGGNGQGKLNFYTKQSTSAGIAPVLAMTIDESGDVCGPDSDLSNCSSDARLKENITPYEYGLDEILKLNPVTFNWNNIAVAELGYNPNIINTGMIAQEVEQVIPDWVDSSSNGYKYIPGSGNLKYALVKAVQEQQEMILQLGGQVEELKSFALGDMLQGNPDGNLNVENLHVVDAAFGGNITVLGHAIFGEDTAGQAKILAGDTNVSVVFKEEYREQPVITITPNSRVVGGYWLADKTIAGFSIVFYEPQTTDVIFDWHAFGSDVGRIHVSDGSIENITVTVIDGSGNTTSPTSAQTDAELTQTNAEDTEVPVIVINGNNPAEIEVGASYRDLGATVIDDVDSNLGIHASVNGVDVGDISNISINTETSGTYSIIYYAVDQAGNRGEAKRAVIVGDITNNQQPTTNNETEENQAEGADAGNEEEVTTEESPIEDVDEGGEEEIAIKETVEEPSEEVIEEIAKGLIEGTADIGEEITKEEVTVVTVQTKEELSLAPAQDETDTLSVAESVIEEVVVEDPPILIQD